MNFKADKRPSPDVRESGAELQVIELQRQRADVLAQIADIDANDPAQESRAAELAQSLSDIKQKLENAKSKHDAVENEQDLRRLGEEARNNRTDSAPN